MYRHAVEDWKNAARQFSKNEVVRYFFNAEKNGMTEVGLRNHWQVLAYRHYSFSPKELSIILHRTARYLEFCKADKQKEKLKEIVRDNLNLWEENALLCIDSFEARNFSSCLWSYATLGIEPSEFFFAAWEQKSLSTLNTFTPQNLANSLWAMTTLGIDPSESFFAAWKDQTLSTLDHFTPQNLCNSLWAISFMDTKSFDCEAIGRELMERLKHVTT
jgi:hypothetical protein